MSIVKACFCSSAINIVQGKKIIIQAQSGQLGENLSKSSHVSRKPISVSSFQKIQNSFKDMHVKTKNRTMLLYMSMVK